ncbi:MAG: hypothetical protein ISP49_04805 [Reyranella sp.]|jgi:hypothetical protein|nr:hypothetical protein [Reyranella sp.]MBL6650889.1 hypothetical protein [Reyranella sp.]
MIRNAWPQSAWAKVALIAAMAFPVAWLLGLWSLIGDWLTILAGFLADSTLVPNWILGLLAICAIIVAGLFGASLRPPPKSTATDQNEPPEPPVSHS